MTARFALPGALLLALAAASCGEDGPALPENLHTQKFRTVTVAPNQKLEGASGTVRPLNGMHGAPEPVVPGDADLRTLYWGRPAGSTEPDGAHVRLVRVGADTLCGVSLDGLFPDPEADPNDPASYDFDTLDERVESVRELNTARVLWQAAFNPGGACDATERGVQQGQPVEAADAGRWATVAVNTLRHLDDGDAWDPDGHRFDVGMVEFLDDPIERMGYAPEEVDALFPVYGTFADRVKAQWPDVPGEEPTMAVGGLAFTLESPDDLEWTTQDEKHPLLRFIDYCAAGDVPLDLLTFRTRTVRPEHAAEIATELRDYLDTHPDDAADRLAETRLVFGGATFQRDDPDLASRGILDDPALANAYLGAFQSAVRILAQDVPVDHMVAGRGPRVFADLQPHAGEDLDTLRELLVPSRYFDADAVAKPAFVSMFPFRQVTGQRRVLVEDRSDMAVLASHDPASDRVLHVIIADANVRTGDEGLNAYVTYDLRLRDFVPSAVRTVEYKLAVLDRGSFGTGSFHFSETGVVDTLRDSGTVSFTHDMTVPSIHYIQFVKPALGSL
ncbi:MAG: hypothetical protein ACQEXJ_23695 [Myxococcota bacterium]